MAPFWLLGLVALACGTRGFIIRKENYANEDLCTISLNDDLPTPEPLLLVPGGSHDGLGFLLPDADSEMVHVRHSEKVRVACPGEGNFLEAAGEDVSEAIVTCVGGTDFLLNGKEISIAKLHCKAIPVHTARPTGKSCNKNKHTEIEIGFQVGKDFYTMIHVCFDNQTLSSVYSNFTLVSGIGGSEKGFPRPSFIEGNFYEDIRVSKLYARKGQLETVAELLGSASLAKKYISETNDYFLARGHMTAKADLNYGAQQRTTFYYINVAPQWQTFNGGNWAVLEQDVRNYAITKKVNLRVYTGTYGITTLPDIDGEETELYLYVDENGNDAIPTPMLYWKAVYNPETRAGVVFLGVNNPYINPVTKDYILCTDVSDEISWLTWDQHSIKKGYSYSCEVEDFREIVDTLPEFTVSSLLT